VSIKSAAGQYAPTRIEPNYTPSRITDVRASKKERSPSSEWDEFDLGEGVWKIPEGKMKARRAHAVPLSRHVVAYLKPDLLLALFERRIAAFRDRHVRLERSLPRLSTTSCEPFPNVVFAKTREKARKCSRHV